MPIPVQHFYMIRHGETEANVARIMAGSMDSPLTENGRQQARDAARIVEALAVKPSYIAHSHLSRARDTAIIINESLNLPMIEDEDLAEIHSGDYEGVPYDQCQVFLDHQSDPPGGETFQAFSERIIRVKNRLFKNVSEAPPLIVSHGGFFRGFGSVYGIKCKIVGNCRLHEFEPRKDPNLFPWSVWEHSEDGREITDLYDHAPELP